MRRATPPASFVDRVSRWTRFAVLALVALLTSCATTSVELTFNADPKLNTNSAGTSTPVTVRVYALSQDHEFEKVEIAKIWDGGLKALPETGITMLQELVVNPGIQGLVVPLEVSKATGFLGVMALFRETASSTAWRRCVSVEAAEAHPFELEGSEIRHGAKQ